MIFVLGGSYQGKLEYAKKTYGNHYLIIDGYQRRVRKQLEEGKDPLEEAEAFWESISDKNTIIICDEVGSGIVPMEKGERIYREMTGRVSCYFAEKAEEVIRVTAGIGIKIK